MAGSVWAIVLAAGRGTRFGDDKQFALVGGVRLVDRAVSVALATCDEVVLVLPPGQPWDGAPVAAVVPGGTTRAGSVRAGLVAVDPAADIVVVHDAAHPLASRELFDGVIAGVRDGAAGAVPVVGLPEALKRVRDDRLVATVPRQGLVQAQTPQAFRADVLRAAHARGLDVAEDSELLEQTGAVVTTVRGEARNVHVTTPQELALVDCMLAVGAGDNEV